VTAALQPVFGDQRGGNNCHQRQDESQKSIAILGNDTERSRIVLRIIKIQGRDSMNLGIKQ